MLNLAERWKRTPKAIRQTLVFIVGSTVVLTGILLLVLPGPGWAAIFVGFAILATEFAFAERVRDWLIIELKRIVRIAGQAWHAFWRKLTRKK